MTRWCIVPHCTTGNIRYKREKHSVFSVPKDLERLKQWEEAIPGNIKLKETHVVCDKHFEKDVILRDWIHRDSAGQIVAQVPYKHPRLTDVAVPTIFGNYEDTSTIGLDGSVDLFEEPCAESTEALDEKSPKVLLDETPETLIEVSPEVLLEESAKVLLEGSPEARRAESLVEMEYVDCSNPDDVDDPTEYKFVATFKDPDTVVVNGSNPIHDEPVADGTSMTPSATGASNSVVANSKEKELFSSIEVVDLESERSPKISRIQRRRKFDPPPDLKRNPFAVFSKVSTNQHSNSAAPITTGVNDSHTLLSSEPDFVPNFRKKTFAVASTVANSPPPDTGTRIKRRYSRVQSESDDTTPIRSAITDSLTRLSGSRVDQTPSSNTITCDDLSCTIPPSWGVSDLPRETGQLLVFSYSVTRHQDGIYVPVTQRSVTLDAEKNIEYFVYGRRVNAEETILDRILDTTESLSNILLMFQWMSICNGLGNVATEYIPTDCAYLDYVQLWRDNDCALLSSRKRCDGCAELRRRVMSETARITGRETRRRCRKFLSPAEKLQLEELKKMHRLEKRRLKRAELRAQLLVKRESFDADVGEEMLAHPEALEDDYCETYEMVTSVGENDGCADDGCADDGCADDGCADDGRADDGCENDEGG